MPWNKRWFLIGVVLTVLVSLLSACAGVGGHAEWAGMWSADVPEGNFRLFVSPDGQSIPQLDAELVCGDVVLKGAVIGVNQGFAVDRNGNFRLTHADLLVIAGQLSGTEASGTYTFGTCSGNWKATLTAAPQNVVRAGDALLDGATFVKLVRYHRYALINQFKQLTSAILKSEDPDMQMRLQQKMILLSQDLQMPNQMGEMALERWVDDALVRQEAQRRGIKASRSEVDAEIHHLLGYYPEGTPTPQPDLPAPTSISKKLFDENWANSLADIQQQTGLTESEVRQIFEGTVLARKLMEALYPDLYGAEEQVHVRHMVFADQQTAQGVADLMLAGSRWEDLAAASLDTDTAANAGDLGWIGRGVRSSAFDEVAFSLEIGKVSAPVQTEDGWELIQVLARETRPFDDVQLVRQQRLERWLQGQRTATLPDGKPMVERFQNWQVLIPYGPALPPEALQLLPQNEVPR
ncbi:MAG: peptidylprolyl isomerase [Longilinea sp.]|nr:peptidylprolyl isomerase [Longilinea sp.]MCA1954849.1 peptidylprolyl isomerase [Anaerolinea sp.]